MTDRNRVSGGDPAAELHAAQTACALADRSDLGRLLGTGKDVLDLLHRLSTQDLKGLEEGGDATTVVTTAKGKIVERLFVHRVPGKGVMVVTGPGRGDAVAAHLRRFTFGEDLGLADVTATTRQMVLVGPRASNALARAGLDPRSPGIVAIVRGNGFELSGHGIVVDRDAVDEAWTRLEDAVRGEGGQPAGPVALEAWRVLRGLPVAGAELTEERNPLEAGLREAVSFTKGCYVGQEVIARLNTYDKVSRVLVGLVFDPGDPPPEPGTVVAVEGKPIGAVTSAVVPPGQPSAVALAIVKARGLADGAPVTVGEGRRVVRVRRVDPGRRGPDTP